MDTEGQKINSRTPKSFLQETLPEAKNGDFVKDIFKKSILQGTCKNGSKQGTWEQSFLRRPGGEAPYILLAQLAVAGPAGLGTLLHTTSCEARWQIFL